MTRLTKFSLVAIAGMVMLVASPVTAQTVTFGGLPGGNGSAFTAFSQNGFDVSVIGGQICVGTAFGNPTPSLFGGSACGLGAATLRVTRTGGGLFRFLSADIAANNGDALWSVVGLNGGGAVYADIGSVAAQSPFGFTTVGMPGGGVVDQVRLTLATQGTSYNVDNLQLRTVVSVPEPGSMLLVATGFLGLVGLRRRREDALVA